MLEAKEVTKVKAVGAGMEMIRAREMDTSRRGHVTYRGVAYGMKILGKNRRPIRGLGETGQEIRKIIKMPARGGRRQLNRIRARRDLVRQCGHAPSAER